jgi:curved DNA-binding protein CbpA
LATYYEQLNTSPSASVAEIEAACDRLYDEWRRLVTHPDRDMAIRAERALDQIETMRSTLLDSSRRSIYDAAIGVTETVGGLADLDFPGGASIGAGLPFGAAPPPVGSMTPFGQAAHTPPAPPRSPWACPNPACGTDNPSNTQYCLNCGAQVVRACPECRSITSMVRSGFCGKCGFKYEVALERRDLVAQITQARQQLLEAERKASEFAVRRKNPEATHYAALRDRLAYEVENLQAEHARLDHRVEQQSLVVQPAPPTERRAVRTASGKVKCPRCGYENSDHRVTCKGCRWTLADAYRL